MSAPDSLIERAIVVREAGAGAWWVRLTNGHSFVARALRRDADRLGSIEPGKTVSVSLSPGDVTKGVLVVDRISEIVGS